MHLSFQEIEPFVRQGLQTVLQRTYNDRPLKTRDSRLFYIVDGTGEMVISGRAYPLSAGTVILFQSGTEYIWRACGITYAVINFDYTGLARHIRQTFSPLPAGEFPKENFSPVYTFSDMPLLNEPIVLSGASALGNKIKELVIETHIDSCYHDEYLSSLLKFILVSIVRQKQEEITPERQKGTALTRRMIEYIQGNFQRPIQNEDIAAHLHFNASYLNRVFKQHTGMTIHRFLLMQRLNAVLQTLESEDISIAAAAEAAGFSDIPHFTKTFKKHVGKTPKEYRQLHQK